MFLWPGPMFLAIVVVGVLFAATAAVFFLAVRAPQRVECSCKDVCLNQQSGGKKFANCSRENENPQEHSVRDESR